MTLEIDTTRALRSPALQRDLIAAILAADPRTPETNWVEWKAVADVNTPKWRAELGRQILGFANREPGAASAWMGGCAYFVIGATPGTLSGTVPHDPAKLEDWIAEYVGQGSKGPLWTPAYHAMASGQQVLLITVEAPEDGHPIWTFRKEYSGSEPTTGTAERLKPLRLGSIFVRRMAKTETANPDEIDMLTRRACASSQRIGGLSLLLKGASRAVVIDASERVTGPWVETEREALKPPPYVPPKRVGRPVGSKSLADALDSMSLAANSKLAAAFAEPRTKEQFQAEVDAYIDKAISRMALVMFASATRRGLGRIDVSLRNETKRNVHQVEVELTFDVDHVIAFWPGELGHPSMPDRPVEFGKGSRYATLSGIGALRLSHLDPMNPLLANATRGDIDNSGPVRITFAPLDLYPEKTETLDEFFLITGPGHAGSTLTATWTARAKNADDTQRGTLLVPVSKDVPSREELTSEDPFDEDEDEDD